MELFFIALIIGAMARYVYRINRELEYEKWHNKMMTEMRERQIGRYDRLQNAVINNRWCSRSDGMMILADFDEAEYNRAREINKKVDN